MLLEERPGLAVPGAGAFEVGRVARALDTLEARAGHVLVDLLRQLGPDEPVLVAGQEERGDSRCSVLVHWRRETAELLAEVGRPRRVEAGDLRVEERADGLGLAECGAEGGVPQDRRAGRARGGELRAERGDLWVREIADRVPHDDPPEPLGGPPPAPPPGPPPPHRGERRPLVGGGRRRAGPPGRLRRLAEPPLIVGDAAVLLGEDRRLLPPAQVVAGRAVQEEQRGRVAAGVLVVEEEPVLDHERHERSPLRGPRVAIAPRAVNAILTAERTSPWRPTSPPPRSRSSRAGSRRGSSHPSSWSRR